MGIKRFEKRINKIPFVIFLIAFLFFVSLFIAPLTLEPGTVEGLDGEANRLSYSEKWQDLPIYQRIIYTIGDFNCHQKHYRSFSVNSNQMPLCARDVGIFFGFAIGFLVMTMIVPEQDYKDILLKFIPFDLNVNETKKIMILILLGAVFALPMALDGGIQLVTGYESTNMMRLITGSIFGVGFSVFISALLISAGNVIQEASNN